MLGTRRGGERRGYETDDRIGDPTAPLDPQSAPFPNLSTFGPFGPFVICGVCFYVSLTASSSLEGYTHEKYADSTRFRPRGAGASL